MRYLNVIAAAAVAVPLMLAGSSPSTAGSNVDVRFGFGTPYYGHSAYPYYPYYGDVYYRDRFYDDDDYVYRPRGKMSCWQAKQLVRDRGFRRVRTVECNGRIYTFEAIRRGKVVVISVNARTGAVWRKT